MVVMSSAPGARFRGLAGELCHARENGTFRVTSQTVGRGSALKRRYMVSSACSSRHERVPEVMCSVRAISAWAALQLKSEALAHLEMHSRAMASGRTRKTRPSRRPDSPTSFGATPNARPFGSAIVQARSLTSFRIQNPESRIQTSSKPAYYVGAEFSLSRYEPTLSNQQAEFGIENHQLQNSIAAAPRLSFEQNSRWALHVSQNLGLRDHLNSDAGFTREFERHVQLSQNFTWSSHLNFRIRVFRRAFN